MFVCGVCACGTFVVVNLIMGGTCYEVWGCCLIIGR